MTVTLLLEQISMQLCISQFSSCQYILMLSDGTSKAFCLVLGKSYRLIQIPALSGNFCLSLEQAHAASLYLHCLK